MLGTTAVPWRFEIAPLGEFVADEGVNIFSSVQRPSPAHKGPSCSLDKPTNSPSTVHVQIFPQVVQRSRGHPGCLSRLVCRR